MGNKPSTQSGNKEETLIELVDLIATNYILESSFQDMKNLAKAEYCEELVILTSKVIASKLNDMEIKYLGKKMQDGNEVDFSDKDRMVYLRKKNLDKLDISNPTKKRHVCVGIAKYYVKIAHLFSAIITTINPVYVYTDINNETKRLSYKDKELLPANVRDGGKYDIETDNICDNRLNALKNKENFTNPKDGKVTVSPTVCGMNSGKLSLNDEPGIPEFAMLFNDIYDDDRGGETAPVRHGLKDTEVYPVDTAHSDTQTNKKKPEYVLNTPNDGRPATAPANPESYKEDAENFLSAAQNKIEETLFPGTPPVPKVGGGKHGTHGYNKMSDGAKKSLQIALEEFHFAFTGKPIPKDADGKPTITKAGDILLKNYSAAEKCAAGGLYTKSYHGNIKDDGVFANYANHLKKMMQNTETNRNKLIAILKEVFIVVDVPIIDVDDSNKKKTKVSIHHKLTENSLQLLIDKTRETIIKIYVDCEKDFIKGLELFDAIIEKISKDMIYNELTELYHTFDGQDSINNTTAADRDGDGDDDADGDGDDDGDGGAVADVAAAAAAADADVADAADDGGPAAVDGDGGDAQEQKLESEQNPMSVSLDTTLETPADPAVPVSVSVPVPLSVSVAASGNAD